MKKVFFSLLLKKKMSVERWRARNGVMATRERNRDFRGTPLNSPGLPWEAPASKVIIPLLIPWPGRGRPALGRRDWEQRRD